MNTSAPEVVLVPAALVTVMSTAWAEFAGATAVIWVELFTLYDVALLLPNLTPAGPATPLKPRPVMVTEVPPARGPADGLTPVTVGAP